MSRRRRRRSRTNRRRRRPRRRANARNTRAKRAETVGQRLCRPCRPRPDCGTGRRPRNRSDRSARNRRSKFCSRPRATLSISYYPSSTAAHNKCRLGKRCHAQYRRNRRKTHSKTENAEKIPRRIRKPDNNERARARTKRYRDNKDYTSEETTTRSATITDAASAHCRRVY